MTTFSSGKTNRVDQRTLDRLVDGELTVAEQQRVLWDLQEEPDGWKRCALSFLEAQSWRAAAQDWSAPRSVLEGQDGQTTNNDEHRFTPNQRDPKTRNGLAGRIRWGYAATTVIVAAVSLGLGIVWERRPGDAADQRTMHDMGQAGDRHAKSDLSGYDSVTAADNLQVGPRLLANGAPRVATEPIDIDRALRELGHGIRRHQGYLPVDLQDGGRGWAAVEEVELFPISYGMF